MLASMFEDYCRMYLAVNEGDIGAQGDNQYYGETDEADDEL